MLKQEKGDEVKDFFKEHYSRLAQWEDDPIWKAVELLIEEQKRDVLMGLVSCKIEDVMTLRGSLSSLLLLKESYKRNLKMAEEAIEKLKQEERKNA